MSVRVPFAPSARPSLKIEIAIAIGIGFAISVETPAGHAIPKSISRLDPDSACLLSCIAVGGGTTYSVAKSIKPGEDIAVSMEIYKYGKSNVHESVLPISFSIKSMMAQLLPLII